MGSVREIVKCLEEHPENAQAQLDDFLNKASQPRHVSGNACINLCYFIEQCRSSKTSRLRELVFSHKTCIALFGFFIEWNEKNQNRSMRQVLELVSSTISLYPDQEVAASIKKIITQRILSILKGQESQPLVKPAFKSLECFLSKGTLSPQNIIKAYQDLYLTDKSIDPWDSMIPELFDWLTLPDISPAAGKCIVTLFSQRRKSHTDSLDGNSNLWQRWIRSWLRYNPDALENVKNYLLAPLFKLDRSGSLAFLEDLNQDRPVSDVTDEEMDAHSLLQLAAMEVGKKAGLVEESSTFFSLS